MSNSAKAAGPFHDVTGPVKPDRFLTFAQFSWHNFAREFAHYDLADVMHMLCPCRPENFKDYPELGGFCLNVTPNVPFPPADSGNMRELWHRQIEALRKLGKPFDFFGIFAGGKLPEGPGYYATGCTMTEDEYTYMMEQVGDLFIGWDLGEWDGLYGRDVVHYWQPEELPKTRQEAYGRFMEYLRRLHGYVYNNACTIVGCTFPHYFHELPIRLLGAEVGQGLLNYQVYNSFLRGAERQYGLKSKIITSVFDRWGYTQYAATNKPCAMPDDNGTLHAFRADALAGHSIGLHFAMWVTGYYAGAAIMGLDGAYYTDELDKRGVRQLSPLGAKWMEFREWARNPSPRGEQVRPLALLLDYHCGWTPPRHLYSMKRNTVWHSLPYGPCDHGMDRAYDLFYPGYTESGFYRDERGFITPTPSGDCVDVLLSDATTKQLAAYPIVWHLSDEVPADDFLSRLRTYVEQGGHLVVSGSPMAKLAKEWFGMHIGTETRLAVAAQFTGTGEPSRENNYSHRFLPLDAQWQVAAVSDDGSPLIATRPLEKGTVTFLAADHGLTDDLTAPGFDLNPRLSHTPEVRFELLRCVQRHVRSLVHQALPVRVDTPGIYFAINKIDDDRLALCLYNPGYEEWRGRICVAAGQRLLPLAGCWNDAIIDGNEMTIPANATTVVEIQDRPD